MEMQVNIKRLDKNAVIPSYAKPGDAGMDLTAIHLEKDEFNNFVYRTGLAIEIPTGFVGLIFPRSSNSKQDLYLTNHVGVIDSGYRGEIMIKFRETLSNTSNYYGVGERVAQLMIIPYPSIEFQEVEQLSETERGTGGFGHTN